MGCCASTEHFRDQLNPKQCDDATSIALGSGAPQRAHTAEQETSSESALLPRDGAHPDDASDPLPASAGGALHGASGGGAASCRNDSSTSSKSSNAHGTAAAEPGTSTSTAAQHDILMSWNEPTWGCRVPSVLPQRPVTAGSCALASSSVPTMTSYSSVPLPAASASACAASVGSPRPPRPMPLQLGRLFSRTATLTKPASGGELDSLAEVSEVASSGPLALALAPAPSLHFLDTGSPTSSMGRAPTEELAPFRLTKLIGRGAFADVYLGEWEGVKVAVKVIAGAAADLDADLPADAEWEARREQMAQMEAILLSAITHPYIVTTYQVSASTGQAAVDTAAAATAIAGCAPVPEDPLAPLQPPAERTSSSGNTPFHTGLHQRQSTSSPQRLRSGALLLAQPSANSPRTSPRGRLGTFQNMLHPSPLSQPPHVSAFAAAASILSPGSGGVKGETEDVLAVLRTGDEAAAPARPARRLAPGPPPGSHFQWHMVMEYCDQGSLSDALANHRFHVPVDAMHVRWDAWAALRTLDEILQALQFLHEHRIVHGDLKAANVLLASSSDDRRGYVAQVSDFGLSRVLRPGHAHIRTKTYGTVTHMPPELLSGGTLSPAADTYAFGIVMWELYSAERAFRQLTDSEVVLAVALRRTRPPFLPDTPPQYRALAERCWAHDPAERPDLADLRAELHAVLQALCPLGDKSEGPKVQAWLSRRRTPSFDPDNDEGLGDALAAITAGGRLGDK